ncbi:TPA: P-loop NTPase fold protein [Enterobacter hormaechei]
MENPEITFEDRDEFNRKPIAENLIKLLDSDIDISPMIIDGMWGTGKTEFCHKVTNSMQHNNKKVVYINAFAEDHADAPLLTILSAIVSLIPDENNRRKNFIKQSIPAIKFAVKTTMKAGISWVLKQEADKLAEDFQGAISEISNTAIDNTVENILTDHIESQKNIQTLKDALISISSNESLNIFIDELDRCKPSFAVSILECIKHIFDVPNVNFILVTNTQQLVASINHIYGESVDARKYLDKFIKFTYQLPERAKIERDSNILASHIYWKILTSENNHLTEINRNFIRDMNYLVECNRLSLRDTEKFIRYIKIIQRIDNNQIGNILYGKALAKLIAVYIFCFNTNLAINIANGNYDIGSTLGLFNLNKFNLQRNLDETPNIVIALFNILKDTHEIKILHPELNDEIKGNWLGRMASISGSPVSNVYQIFCETINKLQLK